MGEPKEMAPRAQQEPDQISEASSDRDPNNNNSNENNDDDNNNSNDQLAAATAADDNDVLVESDPIENRSPPTPLFSRPWPEQTAEIPAIDDDVINFPMYESFDEPPSEAPPLPPTEQPAATFPESRIPVPRSLPPPPPPPRSPSTHLNPIEAEVVVEPLRPRPQQPPQHGRVDPNRLLVTFFKV